MEAKDIKTMTYAEYKKQTNWIPRISEIIDLEDFRKTSRKQYLVHQRYYLMWFLKENTKLSFTKIGLMFNRDHATVIYGIKCHHNLTITGDKVYRDNIRDIKTFLELKY